MGGIGCDSRWVAGSAGIGTPSVLLAQSFRSMPYFGRALHIKGVHAVLADNGFLVFGLCFAPCWAFQVVI